MLIRSYALTAALLLGVAGTAAADIKVSGLRFLEVKAPQTTDKIQVMTRLGAVISGASPGLRAQDIVIKIPDGQTPVAIKATKAVPYLASDEEMSVFILVQGNGRFMGSPETEGYLEEAKQAVDVIARSRPRHTRVGLYVYGANVVEKVPMGPPEAVSGELLGATADYGAVVDKALQRGLEEARRVLSNEPGRRVLFVIGDGSDQREDYSPRHDAEQLEATSIELFVLGASPKEAQPIDRRRLEMLARKGSFRYANQREQVVQLAGFLVNEMNNVYAVEFPDVQPEDSQVLPVDGEEHDLVIKAGVDESSTQTLKFPGPFACRAGIDLVKCMCPTKPPRLGPPCPVEDNRGGHGWLWALLGATALAGVAGAVLVMRRRDPDDGEEDDAIAAPVPQLLPPAPPPVMVEARNTVALQPLQILDNDYPLVGWIVPITGSAAYQTFRLGDRTVIGAAPDCQVRLDDPHLSAHHAEIVLKGKTFVLVDRESRNGVEFSNKRIEKHTLVDNDQFTCGSTSFKFKCTFD